MSIQLFLFSAHLAGIIYAVPIPNLLRHGHQRQQTRQISHKPQILQHHRDLIDESQGLHEPYQQFIHEEQFIHQDPQKFIQDDSKLHHFKNHHVDQGHDIFTGHNSFERSEIDHKANIERHSNSKEYYDHSQPAKYNFNWVVKDEYSGNDFGHQESRDKDETYGIYYNNLPDGRLQKVEYSVSGKSGFVAKVSYEGEAKYPEPKLYSSKELIHQNGDEEIRSFKNSETISHKPTKHGFRGHSNEPNLSFSKEGKAFADYYSNEKQHDLFVHQPKHELSSSHELHNQYSGYESSGSHELHNQYSGYESSGSHKLPNQYSGYESSGSHKLPNQYSGYELSPHQDYNFEHKKSFSSVPKKTYGPPRKGH